MEGFYSVMKRQMQIGGMDNDTLVEWSIIDWLLPLPIRCPSTIDKVAELFASGSEALHLPRHAPAHHSDPRERGKFKEISKVLQRILTSPIRHKLILEKDDVNLDSNKIKVN